MFLHSTTDSDIIPVLAEKEKDTIHAALEQDWTPDSEEEAFSWKQVLSAFTTPT